MGWGAHHDVARDVEGSAAVIGEVMEGVGERSGRLWIVVHGYGRGRGSPFLELLHCHLAARRDALLGRIRVHRTGDPAPVIAPEDVVLFWLGDPLQDLYPECYARAVEIEAAARAVGARVLNPPDALNRTSKLRQSMIWRRANIPCAGAWGFQTYEELIDALHWLPRPFIVRHDCGHAQQDMVLAWTVDEVRRRAVHLAFPVTVLEFIDVRSEYETVSGNTAFERLHHKKRAFVFCDRIVNSHLFFATSPLVSLQSCTFTKQARWPGRLARRLGVGRTLLRDTIAADRAYFESPPEAPETLLAAMRALGLDIAAIDYASTPDGGVILWEANPYFSLPHGSRSVLAEERDAVRRVNVTISALAAVLSRTLEEQARAYALRTA